MSERIEAIVERGYGSCTQRVYDAWLQPALIRRWMTAALKAMGLPGQLMRVEIDARVGGKFCFSDQRPPGEVFHWGSYKQLDAASRIAFTWNAGLNLDQDSDDDLSLVTIYFTPLETGCHVKLVHSMDAQWRDHRERTERGWANMLAHIDQQL